MASGAMFRWKIPVKPGHPDYIPLREAIRKALVDSDMNPKQLCERLGLNRHYVYNYLCNKKAEMEAAKTAQVLKALNLDLSLLTGGPARADSAAPTQPPPRKSGLSHAQKVRFGGKIEFDTFRKPVPDGIETDILSDPRWTAAEQAAFEIVDFTMMDDTGGPGDMMLVLLHDGPVMEGQRVIVSTARGDVRELSCWRAHILDNGMIELWPARKDIDHAITPIEYNPARPGEHKIIGLVIRVVKKA